MLDDPAEQPMPAATASRPVFAPGTLIAVGVWACIFAAFVVLGLRS
jgi:hypothetical protein